jgi:hypothetical protein
MSWVSWLSLCTTRRDFLRHIVNRVISESSAKIPVSVMDDFKSKFARAEDKFGFSVFGGDPRRVADFLSSEEWADIVDYARTTNTLWLLEAILRRVAEEYKQDCPVVASKASEALEALGKGVAMVESETSFDVVVRKLKLHGLKVEVKEGECAEVEQPLMKVKLCVSEGKINYTICKEGKVSTVEALLTVIQKIREI